ncbi:MAG: hypothetical protein ISS56_09235 [Anaerolineae bacterium]|nr:hypothetical protein [Anaerolineae bacterium]
MIRKRDVQWWVLEAEKHPDSAPMIVEELAKRLIELDEQNEQLRNELLRLRRGVPAATDSARVSALQQKVESLRDLLETRSSSEASVVLLSDRLGLAEMSLSRAQGLAHSGDPVLDSRAMLELRCLLVAQPHDELLLLTNKGRGLKHLVADISPLGEGRSWPAPAAPALEPDERVTAAVPFTDAPRFWTIATRQGYVQRLVRVTADRGITQGDPLLKSPFHSDEPVAILDGGRGDILLITRWGKSVRFSQRAIETQGSVALDIEPGDEVASALALPEDIEVLVATASGCVSRRHTEPFSARSRPGGSGKAFIQAQDVLAICPHVPQSQLLFLTYGGVLTFVPVADIPLQDRTNRGTQVCDLRRDPAVSVTLVP